MSALHRDDIDDFRGGLEEELADRILFLGPDDETFEEVHAGNVEFLEVNLDVKKKSAKWVADELEAFMKERAKHLQASYETAWKTFIKEVGARSAQLLAQLQENDLQ
jgi:hypothetical protein